MADYQHLIADQTAHVVAARGLLSFNGHEIRLVSIERYPRQTRLRFERISHEGSDPLPRRIPPVEDVQLLVDGEIMAIDEVVGRGDRWRTVGEIVSGPIPPGSFAVTVTATLNGVTDSATTYLW